VVGMWMEGVNVMMRRDEGGVMFLEIRDGSIVD